MTEQGSHTSAPEDAAGSGDDASDAGPAPVGLGQEIRDAVSVRTVTLVVGVLLLQLGFILSYVGAFHAPTPHRVKVALVAPAQLAPKLVDQLNAIPGHPLRVSAAPDRAAAERQLRAGRISAVLDVDLSGTKDTLYVASAGGAAVETAVTTVIQKAEAAQNRTVQVRDLVPVQPGDARGLTGFYLVVGWIVGGYLVAALLGVAKGARPANVRRAVVRLGAIAVYAVFSGLGGAIIVGPVLSALTGHFVAIWWLGALVVFSAGAVTMAFEVLLGVLGIGVAILVFVILGNPSAGGAYQVSVLPPFWRAISGAIPTGAATETVRRIVYFGSHGIGFHLFVLALYAGVGSLVAVLASKRGPRADPLEEPSRS